MNKSYLQESPLHLDTIPAQLAFRPGHHLDFSPKQECTTQNHCSIHRKTSSRNAAGLAARFLAGLCLMVALAGCSGAEDADIKRVKASSVSEHPGVAVGPVIDNFFENPEWSSGTAETGERLVNVSGKTTLQGKPVDAAVQFVLTDDGVYFYAFELNEIPQDKAMRSHLIERMYGAFHNR